MGSLTNSARRYEATSFPPSKSHFPISLFLSLSRPTSRDPFFFHTPPQYLDTAASVPHFFRDSEDRLIEENSISSPTRIHSRSSRHLCFFLFSFAKSYLFFALELPRLKSLSFRTQFFGSSASFVRPLVIFPAIRAREGASLSITACGR